MTVRLAAGLARTLAGSLHYPLPNREIIAKLYISG